MWKAIADWNQLSPPYILSMDQVLILEREPTNHLPKKKHTNLGSDLAKESSSGEVRRELQGLLYTVNKRAPSLSMVALELYGNPRAFGEIAEWNKLTQPFSLQMGQVLKLKREPLHNELEGTELLIAHWKSLGNEQMVERLNETLMRLKQAQRETASEVPKPSSWHRNDLGGLNAAAEASASKPIDGPNVPPMAPETEPAAPGLTWVLQPVKKDPPQKPAVFFDEVAKDEKPKSQPEKPATGRTPKLKRFYPTMIAQDPPHVSDAPPESIRALDLDLPILPRVVAQSPTSPVYVVQTVGVPVGSICITPPSPLSLNPVWVVQPLPVGYGFGQGVMQVIQQQAPLSLDAVTSAMNQVLQSAGFGMGSGGGGGAGGSKGVVEVIKEVDSSQRKPTGLTPGFDLSPPKPGEEPQTNQYWLGSKPREKR